jgi:hypothetical protein
MSAVEKQEYEKFQSSGEANIQKFRIQSNQLRKPVEISQGQVKATTRQISVDRFDAKIGESDFSLRGDVSNYLAYMFKDGVLKGDFNLKSSFINFSELSNLQKSSSPVTDKKAEPAQPAGVSNDSVTAFQVPKNLDLSFQSVVQKAIYDKMPLNNINGLVKIKDQRMELTNLSMDMLQGKLAVNGSIQVIKRISLCSISNSTCRILICQLPTNRLALCGIICQLRPRVRGNSQLNLVWPVE